MTMVFFSSFCSTGYLFWQLTNLSPHPLNKIMVRSLHGEDVGTLQFFSSELSPQSSLPSHIHILFTHTPLAQVIWLLRQGQFCSSDMSLQSSYLSHRRLASMHWPSLHWNFPDGHEGLMVGTTRAAVGGSVVDGSVRCWFLGSAVESRNIIVGGWNNGSILKAQIHFKS